MILSQTFQLDGWLFTCLVWQLSLMIQLKFFIYYLKKYVQNTYYIEECFEKKLMIYVLYRFDIWHKSSDILKFIDLIIVFCAI